MTLKKIIDVTYNLKEFKHYKKKFKSFLECTKENFRTDARWI